MFELAPKPIWWLPTLGFFLFAALVVGAFLDLDHIFTDPGVARHLRTADFILETHRVPRADPLSFTRAGRPWCDYEWGFEATMGELKRAGGLPLVGAFAACIFAATILGIYRTLLQTGAPLSVLILVTGLAYLTIQLHFEVRPVLFTYLFMALVVEVWRRRIFPLRRDWLFLPLIFVAWANLHAGWAAALAFLALAIAGRVIDRVAQRVGGEDAPVIPWIGLLAVCAFATSFNPWGWGLYRSIFLFATAYKSFALWNEYAQPDFNGPSMSALTVLALLLVFLGARACRRATLWRWEMVVPILFFLYEGLKAQRHVLLLMIIAAVPLAQDLEVLLYRSWWPVLRERMRAFQSRRRLGARVDSLYSLLGPIVAWLGERLREFQIRHRLGGADAWLALLFALALAWLCLRVPGAFPVRVGASVTPELLAFVRDHPDRFQRPLVTTWNAGPLLWNLRPGFRVSFDDRGDFYGDDTVFAFVDLYNAAPRWREVFDREKFDSAILDPYLALNQVLVLVPGWHVVYRDKKTMVYWRERGVSGPGVSKATSP
jgi:hypothetical protein